QEYHTELFAFDPIWRIDEWSVAMLANPNHTRKFSKQDAIPIAEQFLSARESMVSLKEPCLGCAVIKAFVKIGVGIGHTATGGKCLRGSMKIAVHQRWLRNTRDTTSAHEQGRSTESATRPWALFASRPH